MRCGKACLVFAISLLVGLRVEQSSGGVEGENKIIDVGGKPSQASLSNSTKDIVSFAKKQQGQLEKGKKASGGRNELNQKKKVEPENKENSPSTSPTQRIMETTLALELTMKTLIAAVSKFAEKVADEVEVPWKQQQQPRLKGKSITDSPSPTLNEHKDDEKGVKFSNSNSEWKTAIEQKWDCKRNHEESSLPSLDWYISCEAWLSRLAEITNYLDFLGKKPDYSDGSIDDIAILKKQRIEVKPFFVRIDDQQKRVSLQEAMQETARAYKQLFGGAEKKAVAVSFERVHENEMMRRTLLLFQLGLKDQIYFLTLKEQKMNALRVQALQLARELIANGDLCLIGIKAKKIAQLYDEMLEERDSIDEYKDDGYAWNMKVSNKQWETLENAQWMSEDTGSPVWQESCKEWESKFKAVKSYLNFIGIRNGVGKWDGKFVVKPYFVDTVSQEHIALWEAMRRIAEAYKHLFDGKKKAIASSFERLPTNETMHRALVLLQFDVSDEDDIKEMKSEAIKLARELIVAGDLCLVGKDSEKVIQLYKESSKKKQKKLLSIIPKETTDK